MKTELTEEQSKHLIDLGVPKEKASEVENGGAGNEVDKYIYTFTLTDILDILPKEIEYKGDIYYFRLDWRRTIQYDVEYISLEGIYLDSNFSHADELIDALYELLCWVIENGHLKFD